MSVKAILVLCAQALLLKSALGQCTSRAAVTDISGIAAPYGCAAPAIAGLRGLGAPAWANDGLAFPGAGLAGRGLATDGVTNPAAIGYGAAPYGGAGEGNVAVAGELPVAGTTAVAGQVPIMGAVSFGGPVAAAGAVTISGQCACGCGAANNYMY